MSLESKGFPETVCWPDKTQLFEPIGNSWLRRRVVAPGAVDIKIRGEFGTELVENLLSCKRCLRTRTQDLHHLIGDENRVLGSPRFGGVAEQAKLQGKFLSVR